MTAPHHRAPDGTTALFAEVLAGFARLLRGEIALARAEAKQSLRLVARAVGQCTVAVVLGITAAHVLAGACVAALVALGVPHWAAGLLMGAALLVLAYGFARWGLASLTRTNLSPARSLTNLGRDVAALKSMVKSDANV